MGEKQNQPFQLLFNASLKVDFQGSRVTSNGGLILVRELGSRKEVQRGKKMSSVVRAITASDANNKAVLRQTIAVSFASAGRVRSVGIAD